MQTACAATVTSSGFVSFSGEPIELVNRARVPGTSKHTSTVNTMQPMKANGDRVGRPVALPADVRARIAAERTEGRSLRAIAADLNAENVPTARGGSKWHASTVKAVLASLDLDAQAAA